MPEKREHPSIESLIQELSLVVGSKNVLTDIEDLYVYSFEGQFGVNECYKPSIVVKISSKEEEQVIKLTKNLNLQVIKRGETDIEKLCSDAPWLTTVLIDSIKPISSTDLMETMKDHQGKRMTSEGPPPTFFSVLLGHQKSRLIYHCNDCSACSGYCTFGPFVDGGETYSSKGRLLLTRALFCGDLQPTEKLVDSIFTCSNCGQCYHQCTTEGLSINKAIIQARYEIVKMGKAPTIFSKVPKNILGQGNPMGTPAEDRTFLFEEVAEEFPFCNNDVLYWIGCTTSYRFPETVESTVKILCDADIDFGLLGEKEGCCGEILHLLGFWDEGKKNSLTIMEKIKNTGASSVVTNCAGCYHTFTHVYPEAFGVSLPIQVFHATQFFEKAIAERRLDLGKLSLDVTWHDPCDLGRHSQVFEPPRNILKSIPGLHLIEMPLNREHARCCGAGGGMWGYNMDLAIRTARSEIMEDILPSNVEAVVTGCPACYMNFKHVVQHNNLKTKIFDIAELVKKAL